MSMHRIIKIDDFIFFLTIGVERGEKYFPSRNQKMVQQPHQHLCKLLNPPCHYYLCPIINSLVIKKTLAMN